VLSQDRLVKAIRYEEKQTKVRVNAQTSFGKFPEGEMTTERWCDNGTEDGGLLLMLMEAYNQETLSVCIVRILYSSIMEQAFSSIFIHKDLQIVFLETFRTHLETMWPQITNCRWKCLFLGSCESIYHFPDHWRFAIYVGLGILSAPAWGRFVA
jgi:hypothetical protein